MRVQVITEIVAPAERVWKALTRIEEVRAWDGVVPFDVPDHYPEPGQHARWHSALGPWQLMLHDRVMAVEENRRPQLHHRHRLRARERGVRAHSTC